MGLRQSDLEARGGPSNGTVRNIEQAARTTYAARTFAQLVHALDWPDGIVDRILDGTATEDDLNAVVVRAGASASLGRLNSTVGGPGVGGPDISAADLQRKLVDVEGAMAEAFRHFGPLPTKRLLSHAEQLLGTLANAADQSDEMEAIRENHRRTVDMLRAIQSQGGATWPPT